MSGPLDERRTTQQFNAAKRIGGGLRTTRRRWLLIVLSGALLGLSFPPFPFPILSLFALVPLLLVWSERRSGRSAFIDAYAAFLITFAVAIQWPLFHTMPVTAWLSLPPLVILPMWMATPFGLSAPLRKRFGRIPGLLALVAFYLLMEFALRRGPLAFPWTLLGHTQAAWHPINQLAAIGGVPALTLLVLTANTCGMLALKAVADSLGSIARRPRRSPHVWILLALLLVVIAAGIFAPLASVQNGSSTLLRVGIVQPAISAESWANVHDESRMDTLFALTGQLPTDVDLVLWPETALPPGSAVRGRVQRWIDSTGVPLLAGGISEIDERRVYNSALLFRPQEDIREYHKRRLVPFAERVPLQENWPWLRRLAIPSGGVPGYARGANAELLQIQGTRFGVLICFESLFDDFARAYANRDASVIITLTQDGWWGDSFGYRQHLAFNRLRAIETGRPLVQASVSGFSAVVHPDGSISDRIGWMDRAAVVADVPQAAERPLYARVGDWITLLAGVGAAAAALAMMIYRKKQ